MTFSLHPAAKLSRDDNGTYYVPMITVRGAKGRMVGSHTPKGAYREFRTFTNEACAVIEARIIALRCALARPETFRVA